MCLLIMTYAREVTSKWLPVKPIVWVQSGLQENHVLRKRDEPIRMWGRQRNPGVSCVFENNGSRVS